MDYGRFKFEALKKEKESRREHSIIRVKEMKLRPKISEHDFQTKFGYVRTFLKEGDKVKLTIMFRGREMVHQEYGRKLLDRMAQELKEMAIVERSPLVEGRNMIMILSPVAKKPARAEAEERRPQRPAPGTEANGHAPAAVAPDIETTPDPSSNGATGATQTAPSADTTPVARTAASAERGETESDAQDSNP